VTIVADDVLAHAGETLSEELLGDVLALLHDTPSRAGDEARLAQVVLDWGRGVLPRAGWWVEEVAPGRANLRSAYPEEAAGDRHATVLYTHLDTSLSGDPALDHPLTGVLDGAPPRLERDASGLVRGLGLAVSKAPAACALVAYVAVARACADLASAFRPFGVLLAAGGTHRAPGGFARPLPVGIDVGLGLGVDAALRAGLSTDSVINTKGGAPGVLREEPGCLLVRLEVRDRMLAVPARGAAGGAAVRAARVAAAVEEWRDTYVSARADLAREIAPDLGVGAIESGLSYKPDFLPAVGNVHVYLVTLPEDDVDSILEQLEAHVNRRLAESDPDWSESCLSVHVAGYRPGASTAEASPVVTVARDAWDRRFGPGSSVVRGYRGSTDGIIFRRHGIPTVRLGVTPLTVPAAPTTEAVSTSDMLTVATIYADILARLLCADPVGAESAARSVA
jgi:acetylornithine deacetylase/succinyl-diaminopimelate desuccinylase-like protein